MDSSPNITQPSESSSAGSQPSTYGSSTSGPGSQPSTSGSSISSPGSQPSTSGKPESRTGLTRMGSVTETFDKYADESESSSSDEFDSEIDTDKEGKGSGSSSTGKSSTTGSNSSGVKAKRSKKATILSNVSENNNQQDADKKQLTEQGQVLTDDEKTCDLESKESVSEKVATSVTDKGPDPSSGKNEIKDSDQAEKSSAAVEQTVETDGDKLSEKAADDKTSKDSKIQKEEEEVTEAKDKTENKAKLDEAPKTEGTPTTPPPTDVMRRPIPIIIVKPPPSPEEEARGDWEPDSTYPSTR